MNGIKAHVRRVLMCAFGIVRLVTIGGAYYTRIEVTGENKWLTLIQNARIQKQ